MKKGLEFSIEEFAQIMRAASIFDFEEFLSQLQALEKSSLFFNAQGKVQKIGRSSSNPSQRSSHGLDQAIYTAREFVERLDVALQVKTLCSEKVHSTSTSVRIWTRSAVKSTALPTSPSQPLISKVNYIFLGRDPCSRSF